MEDDFYDQNFSYEGKNNIDNFFYVENKLDVIDFILDEVDDRINQMVYSFVKDRENPILPIDYDTCRRLTKKEDWNRILDLVGEVFNIKINRV